MSLIYAPVDSVKFLLTGREEGEYNKSAKRTYVLFAFIPKICETEVGRHGQDAHLLLH